MFRTVKRPEEEMKNRSLHSIMSDSSKAKKQLLKCIKDSYNKPLQYVLTETSKKFLWPCFKIPFITFQLSAEQSFAQHIYITISSVQYSYCAYFKIRTYGRNYYSIRTKFAIIISRVSANDNIPPSWSFK